MEVLEEQEPFIRLFERVVGQFSENIAVVFNDQRLTYKQLNEQANRLAHALREKGCLTSKKESIVAVKLAPSINAIVAMLAIMKAGMVYLPIPTDTDTSLERLQQITEETPPDFTIDETTIQKLLKHKNSENLSVSVLPTDLAYLAYSSGSTGKPKGIEIEHKGLCAPMKFHHDLVGFTPKDCIAQFASLGFDASILEVMVGLGAGGRLCIVPQELRKNSRKLCAYYTKHEVTMAMFTPAMLYELSAEDLPTVRIVEPMGEALPADIVTKFQHKTLLDGYGPTEVSIASAISGEPIYGLTFFVIKNNEDNTLYEEGEGELCIAGPGLARKYVNRPELTAKKFVELDDPRYPDKKIRVYKTGDIVELAQNKLLKIIGRVDRQVKIYGKLIQPEAIDAILQNNPVVSRAYTDIEFTVARHPKITAYLVLSAGYTKDIVDFLALYEAVRKGIGRTAAPTRFVFIEDLEKLPQTSQGKIDTKALKQKITEQKQNVNIIRPVVLKESNSNSEIENKLAVLWKTVLDLPDEMKEMKLALYDNFFHLGGTSILIMQLRHKICEEFKIKISVNQFEKNPTFTGMLRNIVRAKGDMKVISPIVEISPQFSVPHRISERTSPVFFVHTLFSDAPEDYRNMSEYWSSQKPIYGINPLGLQGSSFADESIEEAAQHYVEALLKIQPKGPYLLVGWSLGGAIAYEMARQLRQKNKHVSVVLIDSWSSAYLQNMSEPQFIEHIRKLHEKITGYFGFEKIFNIQALVGKQKSQQIDVMCEALIAAAPEEHHKRLWTIRSFLIALLEYRPQVCDVDVRLIAANETVRDCGERLCWPEEIVFREIECIAGDHHSIFSDSSQCDILTKKVEQMTQYQEAKLKLAPLAKEIAEKYSQIEDDFSEEQKRFYNRVGLLNSNQKRKVSVMGDSRFCGKLIDKICFEWMYASQPKAFDFVLVIDGRRLSAEDYNESVKFENIVHDACFGRDGFGESLSSIIMRECFAKLQRSSILILVKHFDEITSVACKNTIVDVVRRNEVSVLVAATRMCTEWEELKMERVEQDNYVPKAPPVNTDAELMGMKGLFPSPVSTPKGTVVVIKDVTTSDDVIAENAKGDASIINVKTEEGAVLAFSEDGSARVEGTQARGTVHASSRPANMKQQEEEQHQKAFDRARQMMRSGARK